jgi:hypothetical protein
MSTIESSPHAVENVNLATSSPFPTVRKASAFRLLGVAAAQCLPSARLGRMTFVAFLLILAAILSNASAANVTYRLLNYPLDQADSVNGGTDTISGTIITDGTLGEWAADSRHFVFGSPITFTAPNHVYTGVFSGWGTWSGYPMLHATPTQLLIYPSDKLTLTFYNSSDQTTFNFGYLPDLNLHFGEVQHVPDMTYLAKFESRPTTVTGSIGANSPWVIAEVVPEPSTFVLLGFSVASLGLLVWRRRTRKVE